MGPSSTDGVTVVHQAQSAEDIVEIVSAKYRWRRPPTIEIRGLAYWPIADIRATATGRDRGGWVERARGAVDLVSSRTGLVPEQLLERELVPASSAAVIPARVGRAVATQLWQDYFRDQVVRRHRPWQAPEYSLESMELKYVEHVVVDRGGTLVLVDPMTRHAEELDHFPWVREQVLGPGSAPAGR